MRMHAEEESHAEAQRRRVGILICGACILPAPPNYNIFKLTHYLFFLPLRLCASA